MAKPIRHNASGMAATNIAKPTNAPRSFQTCLLGSRQTERQKITPNTSVAIFNIGMRHPNASTHQGRGGM